MIFERKIKDFEGKNEDSRTKYELERNFNRFLKGRSFFFWGGEVTIIVLERKMKVFKGKHDVFEEGNNVFEVQGRKIFTFSWTSWSKRRKAVDGRK